MRSEANSSPVLLNTQETSTKPHANSEETICNSSIRNRDAPSDCAGAEKNVPIANNVADPDAVDWDGPDDATNSRNWSTALKNTHIILISVSVLYCNLATTMFAPGANRMAAEFGLKNRYLEILTVTLAAFGFALGPLVVAPLSEVYGRLPIYRASAIFYLGFTAGCSRSTHVAELLDFRFLTGCFAASYMSCGGGTIADLLPKEKRGGAVALFTAGPLFGPVGLPCEFSGPVSTGKWAIEQNWKDNINFPGHWTDSRRSYYPEH
jgi:hypothetical protein